MFTGHDLAPNSTITLSAQNQTPERYLTFTVVEMTPKDQTALFGAEEEAIRATRLVLEIKGNPSPPLAAMPLSRVGGISAEAMDLPRRRRRNTDAPPAHYITTESLDSDDLIGLWSRVVLTPDEALVVQALKFLDSSIERIAAQAAPTPPYYYGGFSSRGGFIVKLSDQEQPIPIGSMGDGLWRMLAMAIALTQCKGGVLLVDEIDTGLHYTVMADMWRLILTSAKQFGVQVFATTHSDDCLKSLANICLEDDNLAEGVTVQRVERRKQRAVPYTTNELKVVAQRNSEVRG